MSESDWFLDRADAVVSATKSVQIRTGNDATAFIEPHDYYQALAEAIAATQGGRAHFVLLAGWGFDQDTPLDPPVGGESTIGALIQKKSREFVSVQGMIWANPDDSHLATVDWFSRLPHGAGLHDDRVLIAGSHHQKFAVVRNSDGLVAFCGGMDVAPNRLKDGKYGRPWHDVQVQIKGPAALDLWQTFYDRWTEQRPNSMGQPIPIGPSLAGPGQSVQILRTYGDGSKYAGLNVRKIPREIKALGLFRRQGRTYAFAPVGERTVYRLLIKAIRSTKNTIYLEDQYLVASEGMATETALGAELSKVVGQKTFESMVILTNGVGTIQGELFQTNYRRQQLWQQIEMSGFFPSGKVSVWAYTGGPTSPYWMHAKTWIFDDTLALITSANCNRRGYSHDSEIAAAILDPQATENLPFAHELRVKLWMKHLNSKKQRVTRNDVIDFVQGEKFWVEGNDTDLMKLDLTKPDPFQPDRFILDPPSAGPGTWGAFLKQLEKENLPLQGKNKRDFEWDSFIDPDGS